MNSTSVFAVPDFRNLYAARFISTVGARFFSLAISWWVLDSGFKNASSLLGIIMAATAVGTFGFAPFMGALADSYSKKTTMIAALAGNVIVVGITILLFALGVFNSFPLLFALFAILIYAFEPLAETSMQGSLNYIVPASLLPAAVSVVSGITSFSQAIGAAFAGAAIVVLGVAGAFSFDALCYIVSIFFALRLTTALPAAPNNDKKTSFWENLAEGFKYVKDDKALLALLVFFAAINLFVSPIVLALPIIAKTIYNGTALLMSGYEISLGGGVALISTIAGFIKKKYNRYSAGFFAIIFCGASLVGLAVFHNLIVSFVFVFLFGCGMGFVNVSMMTLFQSYVPPFIQGRFFSILNTVAGAVIPLSYAIVGFVSNKINIMDLMFINGCVLAASSFVMLCIKKIDGEYVL
ncbi:MFS transporter [Spirochaetia bacterium]|nr:MFS transporter [Spirochaetia bacterium]GHV22834.1 MFS transporter [Spirochaetia bacterium]